jgi:hypothetical protein
LRRLRRNVGCHLHAQIHTPCAVRIEAVCPF